MAICHTIIVEEKNGAMFYNASSPDELALTNAARHFGITFKERDEDSNVVVHNKFSKEDQEYELLHVIEFTSTRKRMSVVVRSPEGKVLVMTKGADSIILPRLRKGQDELIAKTSEFLSGYAQDGLRTLIVAEREVDEKYYEEWSAKY